MRNFYSIILLFSYLVLIIGQTYPNPCPVPMKTNANNTKVSPSIRSNLPVNDKKFYQPRNVINLDNKKFIPKTNNKN